VRTYGKSEGQDVAGTTSIMEPVEPGCVEGVSTQQRRGAAAGGAERVVPPSGGCCRRRERVEFPMV